MIGSATRYLTAMVRRDALASRKMAFISGPRQVGKTTLAKTLLEDQKRQSEMCV